MTTNFYKFGAKGVLEASNANEAHDWVLLSNPTAEEVKLTAQKYEVLIDYLIDPLDIDEGARIEIDEDLTAIIARVPVLENDGDEVEYSTAPIGIIMTPKCKIIITKINHNIFQSFIRPNQTNLNATPHRVLICLLENIVHKYLQYLRHINHQLDSIENQLLEATDNERLIKLLQLKKSLVHFTTGLKGDLALLVRINKNLRIENEKDLDIYEDISIDIKQAIDMSEMYTHIIISTMNTISSIISNKISFRMKVLTSITILLMVPTLFTSFYGMNLQGLPLSELPNGFYYISGLCALISLVSFIILKLRKWF